ncbi:hypothetical protein [Deinococcus arcticus]|uniref:hypothetical protein n=1 Tax=Deinococcus arcticus TaxID=2136176 RepID=UPI0011B1E513|nr:hypothetical protein [Deinococcus arcticus]
MALQDEVNRLRTPLSDPTVPITSFGLEEAQDLLAFRLRLHHGQVLKHSTVVRYFFKGTRSSRGGRSVMLIAICDGYAFAYTNIRAQEAPGKGPWKSRTAFSVWRHRQGRPAWMPFQAVTVTPLEAVPLPLPVDPELKEVLGTGGRSIEALHGGTDPIRDGMGCLLSLLIIALAGGVLVGMVNTGAPRLQMMGALVVLIAGVILGVISKKRTPAHTYDLVPC